MGQEDDHETGNTRKLLFLSCYELMKILAGKMVAATRRFQPLDKKKKLIPLFAFYTILKK